jgi:multiple sugar transport system ATP-binding protein
MNLIQGQIVDGGVAVGSTVIPIPAGLKARTSNGAGHVVSVGLRPESLELVAAGEGIPAIVDVVEELGAEAYLYAQLADNRDRSITSASDIIARVEPRGAPASGDLIHLGIKDGSVLLFDAETGARITEAA